MSIRPPAHVAPYVEALGEDRAVAFLLAAGGAPAYLAGGGGEDNRLVPVVGLDGLAALAATFGKRIDRVPVAKVWIARVWADRGMTVVEIARRLHTTDKTVRGWLKPAGLGAAEREARRERAAAEKARQSDLIDWMTQR